MNKLDYLAQKEEELRKLNDQLDSKQGDLLKQANKVENLPQPSATEPPKDLFSNNQWTFKGEPKEESPKEQIEEEDNYSDDQSDEDQEAKLNQHISMAEEQIT